MNAKKTQVAPPEQVEALCPGCGEHSLHHVEKGQVAKKGAAVEGTFTCAECGHTHQGLVEVPVPVNVPFLVSDEEGRTQPLSIQVLDEEDVKTGDEFEVEDALVEVTSIETQDGKRVEEAPAKGIKTLWGKDITQVKVSFAMNVGSATRAFEAHFDPEDTIGIGDKFDLDETEVEVKQVITDSGRRRHGRHNVREIRRVWIKRPEGPERWRRGPGAGAKGASRSRARAGRGSTRQHASKSPGKRR